MRYLRVALYGTLLFGSAACMTLNGGMETDVGKADAFAEWDVDDNGVVDKREYATHVALLEAYDVDGSGYLDEEEFNLGFARDFGSEVGDFGDFDTNGDGVIVASELHVGMFETIDADGDGELARSEWASTRR